ncbi:ABC transporter permease [Streptomyces sp. NPDC058855]|uniref:ABC transporter permease n=1 Tax=Streptomyces sp. NPDC058855 TaxID=3346651 RepID=UPI0036A92073
MTTPLGLGAPPVSTTRQWRALSRAMTRQLLRDPAALFFSVVFPLLMAVFFVVLMQLTWVRGPFELAVVGTGPQAAALQEALGDGSTAVAVPQPGPQPDKAALIVPDEAAHTLRMAVDPEQPSVVAAVRAALDGTAWRGWEVTALGTDGTTLFDPMAFVIPGVLAFALLSLALTGTASALVAMRASGTLRLLSTTPARRPAVLLSLLPGRGLLALAVLALMGAGAVAGGLLEPASTLRLLLTTALGLVMLLALGYLLGGLLSSPEVTNAISGLLTPVLLMSTGLLFPLELLPDAVAGPLSWTPLAMFGDALRHDVVGGITRHALWLDWTVMAATAAGLTALAARTFRWDTERG